MLSSVIPISAANAPLNNRNPNWLLKTLLLAILSQGVAFGSANLLSPGATASKRQYLTLPMHFEPNAGQTDPSVDFLSRGPGYTVFLTPSQAVLSLQGFTKPIRANRHDHARETCQQMALAMRLLGATGQAHAEGEEKLSGTVSYFIGNDSSQWRSAIPVFTKVKYPQAYPG